MRYLILSATLLLASCSSVMNTSFYDDNESMLVTEVRFQADKLKCGESTAQALVDSIDKLHFYTESKGSKDIHALVIKMKATAVGMDKSTPICGMKQTILKKQSKDIASAIMGRY